MLKLKEVINQLNDKTYNILENKLMKTKADNFLYVLRSYREGEMTEENIANNLSISPNSVYVLKSRLYERIQDELTAKLNTSKGDIYAQLEKVHSICYNSPREITLAFLHKLEKTLLTLEMHNELLIVYAALKKIHYNTDKYFHYSQLHNKYISFWLSAEKANDILSDFNVQLELYDISKSVFQLDKLKFLRQEIAHHFSLNPSKQLEIIKNIIDIQLSIFCNINCSLDFDITDLLNDTLEKINQLPDSSPQKTWDKALNYLAFEYYSKNGQTNKAALFYEKTNLELHNLLLYSNIALVGNFLTSKITFQSGKKDKPVFEDITATELLSNNTMYSQIKFDVYKAMFLNDAGEIKKAISTLNELLNKFSFKDHFHVHMEIKFTLAFFYLKINEVDMAEPLIVSIYKKIKTEKLIQYSNALDLIKFFNTFFKATTSNSKEVKQNEALMMFFARNKGDHEILYYLQSELENNYFKHS